MKIHNKTIVTNLNMFFCSFFKIIYILPSYHPHIFNLKIKQIHNQNITTRIPQMLGLLKKKNE